MTVTSALSSRTAPGGPTRVTALVAGLAGLALALGACSSSASAEVNEPTVQPTYEGAQITFGRPFEYGDGLFLQVKDPVRFTPSDQAEGAEGVEGEAVRIRFTITNGTRGAYSPHTLSATAVSGGVEATQIIDPAVQIAATGPSFELNRAGVVNFDLAFVVADPRDITLTVVPALGGYEPLVLTLG